MLALALKQSSYLDYEQGPQDLVFLCVIENSHCEWDELESECHFFEV